MFDTQAELDASMAQGPVDGIGEPSMAELEQELEDIMGAREDITAGMGDLSIQEPGKMMKLCCYVIRSTRPPSGSQQRLGSPQATDSPREVWWTVSRNNIALFLSSDVKTTKFNQYLPEVLMSLNVSNSRFRKLVGPNILNVTSSWCSIVASRW